MADEVDAIAVRFGALSDSVREDIVANPPLSLRRRIC